MKLLLTDNAIAVYSFLLLLTAFVAEGISHGLRWKTTVYRAYPEYNRDVKMWHSANVVFIICLVLGVYFTALGSDYIWKYTFDRYFFTDLGFVVLQVAFMRYSIFSPLNNIARGMKICYIGSSATGDHIFSTYLHKLFPANFIFITRIFTLIVCLHNFI